MNSTKRLCLASSYKIIFSLCMPVYAYRAAAAKQSKGLAALSLAAGVMLGAEAAHTEPSFTGDDLLKWDQTSRDSFIQTSMMMAGIVAVKVRPEIARCIDRWYFASDVTMSTRNAEITELIRKNRTYIPGAVILVRIQKECGKYAPD